MVMVARVCEPQSHFAAEIAQMMEHLLEMALWYVILVTTIPIVLTYVEMPMNKRTNRWHKNKR